MSVNKVILMGVCGDLFVGNHETRLYHKGRAANPGAYRMA